MNSYTNIKVLLFDDCHKNTEIGVGFLSNAGICAQSEKPIKAGI